MNAKEKQSTFFKVAFKKLVFFIIVQVLISGGILAQELQVSAGTVQRISLFHSKYVEPRNIDVWLPAEYSPDKKYAVLYMHDGQMLYDANNAWNKQEWGVDETMTALLHLNKIRKCIVVGIWNTQKRNLEYCMEDAYQQFDADAWNLLQTDPEAIRLYYQEEFLGNNYLQFVVEELKPYIDSNFSTLPDRANTFIAGSSRGGLISLYAICKYPEVFGGAACISTHWTGLYREENNPFPEAHLNYFSTHAPDPSKHKIYFDYGTVGLDTLYAISQKKADVLMKEKGYSKKNFMTKKFKGADHTEDDWKTRLQIPLYFLLKE